MGPRIVVILLSLIGITMSAVFAVTDYWIQGGTETGLRRAIRWAPWNPRPHVLMAELDAANAVEHLRRAAALSPLEAHIKIRLAIELEMQGAVGEAEHLLQEAARSDQTFEPPWSLANFYLRRERLDQFWEYAARAAEVTHADLAALLDLCLRVRPEPVWVMATLRLDRPALAKQLLEAATKRGLAPQSLAVGEKMACEPGSQTRETLQNALAQSLEAGKVDTAIRYWNLMARHGHLDLDEIKGAGIVNGEFQGNLSGIGFDWQVLAVEGVRVRGGAGVRIEMSGRQPPEFIILRQKAPVEPGKSYRLKYRYKAETNPAASPARWWVDGTEGPAMAAPIWKEEGLEFVADREWAAVELRVTREPGTIRPEGTLELRWVHMQPVSPEPGK